MKPETVYGFRCNPKDEKVLMQRVNQYLATFQRTTSKARQPALLAGYLPFVIKHFYWNLNKDAGTWFDIYPNSDLNGTLFFPDHKECSWLMRVRIDLQRYPAATQEKAETFIRGLLSAVTFEAVILKEEAAL